MIRELSDPDCRSCRSGWRSARNVAYGADKRVTSHLVCTLPVVTRGLVADQRGGGEVVSGQDWSDRHRAEGSTAISTRRQTKPPAITRFIRDGGGESVADREGPVRPGGYRR